MHHFNWCKHAVQKIVGCFSGSCKTQSKTKKVGMQFLLNSITVWTQINKNSVAQKENQGRGSGFMIRPPRPKFGISRLCGPRQCVRDRRDWNKVSRDQRKVNSDRHDQRKVIRGGQKTSLGGQKIGRGMVENLVPAVLKLVAVGENLVPAVLKLVAVGENLVAEVEKLVAVVKKLVTTVKKLVAAFENLVYFLVLVLFFRKTFTNFSTAATNFSTAATKIRPSRPRYGISRNCPRLKTLSRLWIFGRGIKLNATDEVEKLVAYSTRAVRMKLIPKAQGKGDEKDSQQLDYENSQKSI